MELSKEGHGGGMGNIAIHTINPLLLDQNSWTQTLPNERASRAASEAKKEAAFQER